MTFYDACRSVVLNYSDATARQLAKEGLRMGSLPEIQKQSELILQNLGRWRGLEARLVRATLRKHKESTWIKTMRD